MQVEPETPPATDAPVPATTVLSVQGLCKSFGSVIALDGLDLQAKRGEVYAFLGRNGAGKSTALRAIMGITKPTGGRVELFGQEAPFDDPTLRRRVGYVAQEQHFYGWMNAQSLGRFVSGFYPTWDQNYFDLLLTLLEIAPRQTISGLSGGTRTKLALAVALAHHPDLLILDEPTAGMDPVARREFLNLVRRDAQKAGRTTVFSTHLIDEVEAAGNTVGIVDRGRMIYQGDLQALRDSFLSLVLEDRGTPLQGANVPAAVLEVLRAPWDGAGVSLLSDEIEPAGRRLLLRFSDPGLRRSVMENPEGWHVSQPGLEDIFVAMVARPLVAA